ETELTLVRPTITIIDPVVSPKVFQEDYVSGSAPHNAITFLDPIFTDSESRDFFEAGETYNESGALSNRTQIDLSWTTTINVEDGDTNPIDGALVTILDDAAEEVFAGTSDENGQVVAHVSE